MTGILHEHLFTFTIIYSLILRIIRNFSDKSCKGNQNIQFMFSIFFFENHTLYVIMWKNMVQPNRPQITI